MESLLQILSNGGRIFVLDIERNCDVTLLLKLESSFDLLIVSLWVMLEE